LPGSALSDGAFREGSNWFKRQLATNSKELKPAQVRGLSEPGFRRHWSDRGSHFFVTPKTGEKVDKQRLTQVGRVMKESGVEI
jgi:hypothetical protein